MTLKSWPADAVKVPSGSSSKVPASVAVPVTSTWPNWPLAGAPSIWTLRVAAVVSDALPLTLRVLPAPTVRLPLLVKLLAVEKSAPS